MSLEAIQREIATWDAGRLRELESLIVTLRHRRERPGHAEKMAHLIDERKTVDWVSLEEFDRRVSQNDQP
jgi:hypothetical protein